jgi:hypothetical protein
VLAYVFWHRPRADGAAESYEAALGAFHRSLAHSPPQGLRASASFRVAELPWLSGSAPEGSSSAGYEDWYLLEDYGALGVLNEAAVGHGHRTAHDRAAHAFGAGAGGLFALQEGEGETITDAPLAIWVARQAGSAKPLLAELLGDGAAPGRSSLWRRQLVLGPSPELCLLSDEPPAGVAAGRLPAGWSARTVAREAFLEA